MMRYFLISMAGAAIVLVAVLGWRGHKFSRPPLEIFSDMVRQPKVKAEQPSSFYADGRAARAPVPGTVAFGYRPPVAGGSPLSSAPLDFGVGADYPDTGRMGNYWGAGFPMEVTMEIMRRGRERYGIFCAACHGETGAGNGMAAKFGLGTVQSLLQDRIRVMPEGEIFHTISEGKNTMFGMGDRLSISDRWAIIAYLRALQRSQGGAQLSDIPAEERAKPGMPTP